MIKSPTKLQVTVKTRNKVLFSGLAASVSSKNGTGNFDILYNHANFITLISEYLRIDTGKKKNSGNDKEEDNMLVLQLKHGVLAVSNNFIEVYITKQ